MPMDQHAEKQFEKIAQATVKQCDAVTCAAANYRAGMRHIIATLQEAIAASNETDPGDDD
jgi:hypothetical protein